MSDLPQQNTISQYVADGIVTTYLTNFFVPLETDGQPNIDVYVTLAGQPATPGFDIKVWGVDYTYTPNSIPISGGKINFLAGKVPPSGAIVTLVRNVLASLDVEFSDARNFSGPNLDDALQTLLLIEQQNKTYALQRNLSYVVNSYFPAENLQSNVQVPVLGNQQIWIGTGGGVAAATLSETGDSSVLRSQLANKEETTNGSNLVGYYDTKTNTPFTLTDFLRQLSYSAVPSGTIIDFAGSVLPADYLVCDGAAVSRTTYANLFAAIGTVWGAGDGTTTFNKPNLQRRVTMGIGGSAGAGVIGNTLGSLGGEETHLLVIDEMPTHNHPGSGWNSATVPGGDKSYNVNVPSGTTPNIAVTVAPQGGSQPHNIIQPAAVVYKLIKV